MKKTTYISIAIVLVILLASLVQYIAAGAQVATTTSVRYSFTSNATVTTYYNPEFVWYNGPLAVFMRNGTMYAAYWDRIIRIIRLDLQASKKAFLLVCSVFLCGESLGCLGARAYGGAR